MNDIDVKSKRQELGWSQEQLARELGVSVMTIRRWEAGTNKMSPLARILWASFLKRIDNA